MVIKEIKKVVKVGSNSLMIVIPQKVCIELNITEGNHILVDFIRNVEK